MQKLSLYFFLFLYSFVCPPVQSVHLAFSFTPIYANSLCKNSQALFLSLSIALSIYYISRFLIYQNAVGGRRGALPPTHLQLFKHPIFHICLSKTPSLFFFFVHHLPNPFSHPYVQLYLSSFCPSIALSCFVYIYIYLYIPRLCISLSNLSERHGGGGAPPSPQTPLQLFLNFRFFTPIYANSLCKNRNAHDPCRGSHRKLRLSRFLSLYISL